MMILSLRWGFLALKWVPTRHPTCLGWSVVHFGLVRARDLVINGYLRCANRTPQNLWPKISLDLAQNNPRHDKRSTNFAEICTSSRPNLTFFRVRIPRNGGICLQKYKICCAKRLGNASTQQRPKSIHLFLILTREENYPPPLSPPPRFFCFHFSLFLVLIIHEIKISAPFHPLRSIPKVLQT